MFVISCKIIYVFVSCLSGYKRLFQAASGYVKRQADTRKGERRRADGPCQEAGGHAMPSLVRVGGTSSPTLSLFLFLFCCLSCIELY